MMRARGIRLGLTILWLVAFPRARMESRQGIEAEPAKIQATAPSNGDWELLLPQGEGKDYVVAYCQTCHALKQVVMKRLAPPAWRTLLDRMRSNGAALEDEDVSVIVKYLAESFGPEKPALEVPLDLNKATEDQLVLLLVVTREEAAQIVRVREKNPMKTLADLKLVLSDEKIQKIKPFVSPR